jgi:hypothetical protein
MIRDVGMYVITALNNCLLLKLNMVHSWVLLICCSIPQAVILYGSGSNKRHPLLDELPSVSTTIMIAMFAEFNPSEFNQPKTVEDIAMKAVLKNCIFMVEMSLALQKTLVLLLQGKTGSKVEENVIEEVSIHFCFVNEYHRFYLTDVLVECPTSWKKIVSEKGLRLYIIHLSSQLLPY